MKRPQIIFVLVTFLAILVIEFSFLAFNNSLNDHMNSDIKNRLKESVDPNVVSFHLQMQEQINKVKTFADFLGNNWDLNQQVHISLLKSAVEYNGLLRCAIAYPDGSFITNDEKSVGNVSNDAFFIANMKGEFFITDPRPAVVDKTKQVILFAAPIFDQSKKVIGSVIYSYLCDDIDRIFNLKSMGASMNMVVAKQSGELLIGTTEYAARQENYLNQLRGTCTHTMHSPEECLNLIGSDGTYLLTFSDNDETIYARYEKLEYNDWYMIATVSQRAAAGSISFVTTNQRNLSILVAIVMFSYLFGILLAFWMQKKRIDPKTGAPTIHAFKKKAKKILKSRTDEQYVVVKLDIKDFSLINRMYSFDVGDKIIKNISLSLKTVLNDSKSVFSRVGPDVFLLLLPYEGADALGEKRQSFISYFRVLMNESYCAKINFPTGQYILKETDYTKINMPEILEKVNFAHRAAKQNSDVIIDYEEDIENAALFEKRVEDRMESAIINEEFTLYLQPKIRLKDEQMCGAEALVRWKIGNRYYMYPTDFIPILEKNGFIVQLDMYMFSCAAKFIRDCIDKKIEPFPISVNFSRHHLSNKNFVAELCKIADEHDIPRKYLEIELTEASFVGHIKEITEIIARLHEEGFSISMDDFGSGYSSFAQLKDLNIDVLKIDKEFFSICDDEKRTETIVAGILKIAQDMEIVTVAEGIERKEQVDMLKTLGCDIVQGYYYAKPIPAKELKVEEPSYNTVESDL